ncbi:MAG: amidohydrolase family protein [Gammaproteobacteria bacterium]
MEMNDLILVSVDDHVVEPPHVFEGRAPAHMVDRMPRMVHREDGTDVWLFEDRVVTNIALNAVVGHRREDYAAEPTGFDQIRRGTWDIDARIGDMNVNGQLAGMNFPSFLGMSGQFLLASRDKELALAVCRAWNDWHIDDWCAKHPGRMIPLAIVPLWDPQLAAAEARRVATKGCHAISFPPNPFKEGLPSLHEAAWDPFWSACTDNGIVVCLHFADAQSAIPSPDCPIDTWISNMQVSLYMTASDLVFSPILRKFRDIRFAMSEGSCGWVPYFLERIDQVHHIHSTWTRQDFGDRLPSEVFREHVQTCFIQDATGIKNRHDIGVHTMAWECDYPHADTVWPNCPEILWESIKTVPDDEIELICHRNAMRWYSFDPFRHIERRDATVGALRAKAHAMGVDLTPIEMKGRGKWAGADTGRPISFQDVMNQLKEMGMTKNQTGENRAGQPG